MVAYAAALQESKLHNLSYGDRDSVGVFQQRPSEGWGPAWQLKDPVYATTRFFQALATVPDYLHKPVYRAAQAVQRSADGYAYIQYQPEAAPSPPTSPATAPHAVWCWSAGPGPGEGQPDGGPPGPARAFGPISSHRAATPGDDPAMLVRASPADAGLGGRGLAGDARVVVQDPRRALRRVPRGRSRPAAAGGRGTRGQRARMWSGPADNLVPRPMSNTAPNATARRADTERRCSVKGPDLGDSAGKRSSARDLHHRASRCVDLLDKTCIDECPVDCIYEGDAACCTSTRTSAWTAARASRSARSRRSSTRTTCPTSWKDFYRVNVEFFREPRLSRRRRPRVRQDPQRPPDHGRRYPPHAVADTDDPRQPACPAFPWDPLAPATGTRHGRTATGSWTCRSGRRSTRSRSRCGRRSRTRSDAPGYPLTQGTQRAA